MHAAALVTTAFDIHETRRFDAKTQGNRIGGSSGFDGQKKTRRSGVFAIHKIPIKQQYTASCGGVR